MASGSPNSGFDYREIIGPASAGLTVLEHLVRRYRHSSADEWRGRIQAGRVMLDGRPVGAAARLRRGQDLLWRRPPWIEPDAPLGWALIHRDNDLLGVVKPAGLPTLPGGGYLKHSLLSLVRARFPEAAPVHRLDRGASGLVLFARTAPARAHLGGLFRSGAIEKQYRALVQGEPAHDRFDIDQSIGVVSHARWGLVSAAAPPEAPRARPASTEVRVLERGSGRTLVAVRPLTGRAHQIRVHLAFAGHPLVGEPFYGAGGLPLPEGARPGDVGYHLHAERLRFTHPETQARSTLWCPAPAALRGVAG